MEAPDSIFVAFSAATVISLVVGIPATWALGLSGGIWAINLSDAAAFVMVVFLLRRRSVDESGVRGPESEDRSQKSRGLSH